MTPMAIPALLPVERPPPDALLEDAETDPEVAETGSVVVELGFEKFTPVL